MSDALVWELVKKNHSFLVKRDGIQLSREPFNVMNVNSYKFSGFRARAVDLSLSKPTNPKHTPAVVLTQKASRHSGRPAKQFASKRNITRGTKASKRVVQDQCAVRPDLKKAAVARLVTLQASIKPNRNKKIAAKK